MQTMTQKDRLEALEERINRQYETRCPRAVLLKDRLAGVGAFLRNEEHQAQSVAMIAGLDSMIERGQEATDEDAATVEAVLTSWGAGKFPRRNQ